MYQIKQIPEDFVVKEISNVKIKDSLKDKGIYAYFKLTKKERNTIDAIKLISRKLGIPEKDIGFAGSKDRNAITEQMISIKEVKSKNYKEKASKLELKDITLEFISYGENPICLGDLQGNYFEIVIRNLDASILKEKAKIINYFDEQRFGKNNIKVGRNII
ncbi:tRNA pseudouridine(13) synthase TruD, partial [Nanoarchaeota archaeon]